MSTNHSKQFSRDCMVQALIQLLQTKSLSNITISELTERAGVSRMTYYRNYNSMDEIFSSYLKDLVDAYRQDVADWPDKGNYNDYRNMMHCYEYFDHYREFIACLVKQVWGICCCRPWTVISSIPIIRKIKAGISITRFVRSPVPSTISTSPGSWKIPWNPLKRSYPLSVRSIPDH